MAIPPCSGVLRLLWRPPVSASKHSRCKWEMMNHVVLQTPPDAIDTTHVRGFLSPAIVLYSIFVLPAKHACARDAHVCA